MRVRPDQARRLASCILAGGVGFLALSCGRDGQVTEPDAGVPSFAVSVSSSNFQQCANGDEGGESCFYINGVLNDSKSAYRESDVIAQRFVIPGLAIGSTYQLVFDYGWEKAVNPGHMNYDFIAGWNSTLGVLANPCGDPLGNPSADIRAVCDLATHSVKASHLGTDSASQAIPDAIFTTNAPLNLSTELGAALTRFKSGSGSDAVRFTILGGSFPAGAFDNVTYTVSGDDVTARFTLRFTAKREKVMLLWGGHFADSRDYRLALWDDDKNGQAPDHTGNLTGAAGQSGAPFHFTQQLLIAPVNDTTGIGSLSNNVQGSVLEPLPKASISIGPSATNSIGESHTFTVTLVKDLDDGAGPIPAAGEHVTVTLSPSADATVDAGASTCDNAGANTNSSGQCTLVFSSTKAGTITGTAEATLLVNGTSLTVSTDGLGDNSAPATKAFVAGTIKWLKHDQAGNLLGGATFTVCRTHNWNSDTGLYDDLDPDACVEITDNTSGTDNTGTGDRDGTAGEFEIGGLVIGKYTVKEKTAPAGYTLDPDTENADLTTTTTSFTITTAFVNIAPPQLGITKTPDLATDAGGTVNPGDKASFTITVSNGSSGGPANNVHMVDTLPAGLTWAEDPDKTQCGIGPVTVNSVVRDSIGCNIGTLAAGASFSVTVSATIPNDFLQIPPSAAGDPIEIDGDLDDDAEAGKDWADLPASVFSCSGTIKGCAIDEPTGTKDNSFGRGTKEDTSVPKVVKGSIPNNKSDLLRFYVATERFLTTDHLYLAWSRVQEPNGTTNMDFELNQSATLSGNNTTPLRTAGDLLIRYDLGQGGTVPELGFHRWLTTGPASECEASNTVPCWGKKQVLDNDVDAEINAVGITDPIPDPDLPLSPRTFGEARIDLQASGIFEAGVCRIFGSAYLKSRSSDAFTSELKDFIKPIPITITNCAPKTLNNKAWASATNFKPTNGNLGDPISDTGKIEVTEDTSASLDVDRSSLRFARKPEGASAVLS